MFAPESEETIRLAEESQSKLGDLVKSYDYIKLNNLYDLFVPQRQKSREQLSIVELNWENCVKNEWNNSIAHDVKLLVKGMLIPLAQDTMANASLFETHLKKEMFEDLKYVQSLKKEGGDIQKEIDDFKTQIEKQNVSSRVDDILMQECLAKDILCVTYMSMLDTNNYCDMACKYLDKIKECERLEFELSKQKEFFKNKPINLLKPSLESENTNLKKTVAQFQKDFLKMEAHCVALELKYQNQALKSVLFQENEKLHKEYEHLKQTYKDIFDSIKLTKSHTKVNNDSLIVQLNKNSMENADLKAQLQEKTKVNAKLHDLLNKMKGKSMDTKFVKILRFWLDHRIDS
ncbi:hypothetical protein Tco_1523759 [Tanacetum coccineum]